MLPIRRRLYQSQPGFSPRQIFTALQGAWLEPIQGSIWQENTGVTPTTTGGQTIGLLLDQSKGSVLGPELIPVLDITGLYWGTLGAVSAFTANTITTTGAGGRRNGTLLTPAVNAWFRIEVTYTKSSLASTFSVRIVSGLIDVVSSSANSGTLIGYGYLSASQELYLRLSAADTVTITSISIRQVLGNHAAQSTAANRPTYRLDSNSLPLARHDTTDSLVVSLPNLGSGVFSAAGSVYFATPQGMSALHGQSMGTSYTLPALSTDIYSWIVVPQRLNTALEGRLERYMLRKAGLAAPNYLADDFGETITDDISDPILAG